MKPFTGSGCKKTAMDSMLVRSLILVETGIVGAQVLGLGGLGSLLFTLTFPLTLLLWLVTVSRGLGGENGLVLGIVLVSGICVLANALVTGTVVFAGYFKKLIMFWCTLLSLGALGEYVPQEQERKLLLGCSKGLALLLLGRYLLFREQAFVLNGLVTGYLTFGFTNPNLTAVFLSALCMLQAVEAASERGWRRLTSLVLAGLLAVFVWQTRSRNGQLLLLFFGMAWAICLPDRKRLGLTWLAAAPLVFALAYLAVVALPEVQRWFSFLVGEGKGLDSRVDIWRFALEQGMASPLLGAYSQISQGTGASQMHNSHLDILASYGFGTLALVWLFLGSLLGKRRQGPRESLCRAGFGALLLSGLGEAVLFSGGLGISLYGGFLLMVANGERKGHEDSVSEQLL